MFTSNQQKSILKQLANGEISFSELDYRYIFQLLAENNDDELTICTKPNATGSKAHLVMSNSMICFLFRDDKFIGEFSVSGDGEIQGIWPHTNIHEVASLAIELMQPDSQGMLSQIHLYQYEGEIIETRNY